VKATNAANAVNATNAANAVNATNAANAVNATNAAIAMKKYQTMTTAVPIRRSLHQNNVKTTTFRKSQNQVKPFPLAGSRRKPGLIFTP